MCQIKCRKAHYKHSISSVFSLVNHEDISSDKTHQTRQKLKFRGYFLTSLINMALVMVDIKYPSFYVLSLKTEISSGMKGFGYTKRELTLLKRLSYKKYLTRIFRLKSELGYLFFKTTILCPEQNFLFISSNRTVISLCVKLPMLEHHPKDKLL